MSGVQHNEGYATFSVTLGQDATSPTVKFPYPDATVQVTGTFGSGTVAIEGSNDGEAWVALRSKRIASSNNASLAAVAANAVEALLEAPRFLRASTSDHDMTVLVVFGAPTVR